MFVVPNTKFPCEKKDKKQRINFNLKGYPKLIDQIDTKLFFFFIFRPLFVFINIRDLISQQIGLARHRSDCEKKFKIYANP